MAAQECWTSNPCLPGTMARTASPITRDPGRATGKPVRPGGDRPGEDHHRRRAQPSRHGVLCGRDQPPPAQRHRALPPKALSWWLSEGRQQVLISICFNLGVSGPLAFKRMLAACERGDYRRAAEEMLASKWAGSRPTDRGACADDTVRMRGRWVPLHDRAYPAGADVISALWTLITAARWDDPRLERRMWFIFILYPYWSGP
jgi:hypothetical protein